MKLEPNADKALQISALAHDIDRAIHKILEKDLKDYSKINEYNQEHAKRSAKIISDILKKYQYDTKIINKVEFLVKNHEQGVDKESNILMDADSLAYFEYNIPTYLKINGPERTKQKIKFMYDRMSNKAKKLVNNIKYNDQIFELVKDIIS